ncbi:MAG: hypothetical protein COU35_01230 [Candidatus Magasanikbacteria bacterium CG10_big_fil_rev_8_21_14_0_10_47_10]|uniref:Leucine-binding protein domain-containing protein n=1 Tax=Candidatus Magasanikbacteria bacterium CG10_big_fil_rev_8_21_14_0_10_47_10 TaxID=1974652 RepID=A0A2H0TT02_9BACT|nr:MAG: hypothetical protein COU35_01230 [Candidatus Magasanikbacteria bacterium CG10_big_fil_rev_8_21_14_0_10_47_10]
MKNIKSIALIAAIIMVAGVGCSKVAEQKQEERSAFADDVVKVGVLFPFEGEKAVLADEARRGIGMVLAELGRSNIQLVYANGGCNAETAAAATARLLEDKMVKAIIGGLCDEETYAAAPLAQAAGIVLITPATRTFNAPHGDFIFQTSPSEQGVERKATREFVAAHKDLYDTAPSQYAAESYDAMKAISEALQQDMPLKDALYEVSFEGAAGPVDFDANGEVK